MRQWLSCARQILERAIGFGLLDDLINQRFKWMRHGTPVRKTDKVGWVLTHLHPNAKRRPEGRRFVVQTVG